MQNQYIFLLRTSCNWRHMFPRLILLEKIMYSWHHRFGCEEYIGFHSSVLSASPSDQMHVKAETGSRNFPISQVGWTSEINIFQRTKITIGLRTIWNLLMNTLLLLLSYEITRTWVNWEIEQWIHKQCNANLNVTNI